MQPALLKSADPLRQAAYLLLQAAYLLLQAADLPTVHNTPDPPHDPPDEDQKRDSDLRSRQECFPASHPKGGLKKLVHDTFPLTIVSSTYGQIALTSRHLETLSRWEKLLSPGRPCPGAFSWLRKFVTATKFLRHSVGRQI
jgi:hypothetical protein